MKTEVVSVIDVGSNFIRMIIAQIMQNGEITTIEELNKSSNIGRDTFSYGKVNPEAIYETCETLSGFAKIMNDYKVKKYKAVSTSGIREADNRDYVLEQIRLKTGLSVETINSAQERFYMYKAIWNNFSKVPGMYDGGFLLINIGSGGVEVSVYHKGSLKFTEYVKIGSLRIREMLSGLELVNLNFSQIMKEFIESNINQIKHYIEVINISNFIGLGGELATISRIYPSNKEDTVPQFIKKEHIEELYKKLKFMTTEQIINEYELSKKSAELLLPSVLIFYTFLNMTKAKGIYAPMVSLRHGIIADVADESMNTKRKEDAINDIISSVWYIGQKYGIDKIHTSHIENIALNIFDRTKEIHRLEHRERLYLRVAAILHDIGKYVNLSDHNLHSYNIIYSQDILGFSNQELKIIANITKYHLEENPSLKDEEYRSVDKYGRIIISKLSAILKLAEALDMSHKQKVKEVRISAHDRELLFHIRAKEDIALEEWSFKNNSSFFEEVMGYKPIIKSKGDC
ncbi:HD domain-containing protein [Clostridium sp. DJ247]|uniref:Ppx/GppA phosphatase family protein n=1 Tax=Clostridium sp. DJ247 TaxID=2726188 RepID=UPI0016269894|nr:HD domain-containing protein [Clostridium sp. DJ247]MBC2582861.1 HD domain-containing protein [Clostridium sp. DJ247]